MITLKVKTPSGYFTTDFDSVRAAAATATNHVENNTAKPQSIRDAKRIVWQTGAEDYTLLDELIGAPGVVAVSCEFNAMRKRLRCSRIRTIELVVTTINLNHRTFYSNAYTNLCLTDIDSWGQWSGCAATPAAK